MKAIAVHPGTPNSIHLREVEKPSVDDVPDGRGVLVKVLRVGVDGTDKEINAAEYGAAPPGDDYLITGHESFGQVVEVGDNVPDTITPGTFVVASVRRPGSSIYGRIGLQDFTTDDVYYERGINLLHGYLTEYYVEDAQYVFPLPGNLRDVGVLLEPTTVAEKGINHAYEIQRRLKVWEPRRACILGSGTVGLLTAMVARLRGLELTVYSLPQRPYRNADLIEQLGGVYFSSQDGSLADVSAERGPFDVILDATGFSPIVWEAAEVLGKNGVLVLASITGGDRKVEINSDKINQSFVLGNKVMVGTVNASPNDFRTGVDDLIKAEALFPGWAKQLLTTPIDGLESYDEMIRALTENREAIKVYVEVAGADISPAENSAALVSSAVCAGAER
jgi:threonine dehydrogenase-like Zn-dependent dehydrogenase